ncbi:DUF1189 family protein [Legionella hackeliae]|uniref:DUF1189 domain-containing protein n=1 Tax=Legionella hackeliae TaxID=449 RepID=A0A0A8USG9_LEGHA|nr:DUF1189 family protein [Legionella hackeliae]KTD13772.1 hypothetical protein Lhac_0616 [Legionella hackeliae]CEK10471.1 conserved membrane protein of unknown function [Legionella hackeliae]STX47207.1 Uncharacterised protein [Legionella hackeliae]
MTEGKKVLRKIDTPFYNYFQAIVLSFFSRRLYVDVGKRWKGFGLFYLLLVMFIFTLPFALRVVADFSVFFEQQLVEPIKQLPPIYIQNGIVSFDKPMPYLIKNKAGQVVAIVDTTGTVKSIDNTFPHLAALITKDKFFYRVPSPQFFFTKQPTKEKDPVYVQPLNENINQIFDGKTWVESSGLSKIKWVSQLIIYPTVALIFFAIYLVFLLVFSLMGQFLARLFFHITISYKQTCRLLAVSATPQIFFLLVGLTLDWLFPGFGLVLIILLAFYFSFAVIALKRESQKLVIS